MVDVSRIQPKVLTSVEKQPLIPLAPGKPVEDLVAGLQSSLNQMMELFAITPGITGDDKTKLAGIMKEYKELVTENLGASPGEPMKKEGPEQLDQMSPEAGIAEVMPAL